MTMTEPLPSGGQYGVADWQDYVNNWREADADFLQSRSILRFATTASRDSAYPSAPQIGQVIFNAQVGYLEMSTGAAWVPYKAMPINLVKTTDDASQVSMAHINAAGKGVVFTPTYVGTNADFRAQGGVLTVEASGVSIKTGAKTAKLTTDATNLISDTPITAPSLSLTGTGTVITAPGKTLAIGTLTADSATVTNITVSGTLSGGVLSGPSGTIGGVELVGNTARATSGFISNGGYVYGGANNLVMRYRNPSTGVLGTPLLQVSDTLVQAVADNIYLDGDIRLRTGATTYWYNTGGAVAAYGCQIVYSASDPGAANFPAGTLWISP